MSSYIFVNHVSWQVSMQLPNPSNRFLAGLFLLTSLLLVEASREFRADIRATRELQRNFVLTELIRPTRPCENMQRNPVFNRRQNFLVAYPYH